MLLLLCGYRGTGKDTYAAKLADGTAKSSYVVYSTPSQVWNTDHVNCVQRLPFDRLWKRQAFADALKDEVHTFLQIDGQQDKNTAIIEHPTSGERKILRQWYIEHGAQRRAFDSLYWIKSISTNGDVIVTDWRFINEWKHFASYRNVYTARIWRSNVTEPEIGIASEHDLDYTRTDFLILNSEEEFNLVCQRFPFYSDYVKMTD